MRSPCAAVFGSLRLYRGIWRYASANDLLALTRAATLVIVIFVPALFVLTRAESLPRSVPIINWFVLLFMIGAPRFLYRIAKDRDPFDIYRVDGHAFRLVPLIYSPGRDGDSGLNAAPDYVPWRKSITTTVTVNTNTPYLTPRLTPYDLDTSSPSPFNLNDYLGKSLHVIDKPNNYVTYPDETSTDNEAGMPKKSRAHRLHHHCDEPRPAASTSVDNRATTTALSPQPVDNYVDSSSSFIWSSLDRPLGGTRH